MNPNPGSKTPFAIRIPFEIWNIDKGEQVNLLIYDQNTAAINPMTASIFPVWRTSDRMYAWVVNTKYTPTVLDTKCTAVVDRLTWSIVFMKSIFTTGDEIEILYNKPIQLGVDVYTFTVPQGVNGISNQNKKVVKEFSLSQNFPNPFNPRTTINFQLPKSGHVTLRIYDILGREVVTLIDGERPARTYQAIFDGSRFASGVYFY